MKWFKHISDSMDDPFIFALMEEFGSDGYVVFFGVLEIYSREFSTEISWKLEEKISYFSHKFLISSKKFIKILSKIKKWEVSYQQDSVTIFIPKFKEILDESTLKKLREHENSFRNRSGTVPKTEATDKEEDKDKDKRLKAEKLTYLPVDNSKTYEPPLPASEPDKSAFTEKPKTPKPGNGKSDPYLRELQNLVAQVKTKYPTLAIESWYGKNRGAHQDAILHVLRSFLKAELKYDSGSAMEKYLQNAIDVEDGKYNSRDFDQEQAGKKGPPTVQGMAAIGRIMDSVRGGGRP